MLSRIDIKKAVAIAETKGLRPARVKGTQIVQITKGANERMEVIGWPEFEAALTRRGLAIYEQGGWMKIMKAQRRTIVGSSFPIQLGSESFDTLVALVPGL